MIENLSEAPPPGNRQQQKHATHQDILAAAKTLFLASGYDNTTTRQIAAGAGVGIGTVFAHFPDKHQLVRELLLQDIAGILLRARGEIADSSGAVDALLHYAAHLYGYYRNQWDLSLVLLKESMFNAADYQGQVDAFAAELAARLANDAPDLPASDRATLARCLMANYFMVLIHGLGTPDSTLDSWLAQLASRCHLLVRPYRRVP